MALETSGHEACRPFIEAAAPQHPSLVDRAHKSSELFGFINIPNAVWINEDGVIVRPSEPAPAPPTVRHAMQQAGGPERGSPFAGIEPPQRLIDIMGEASKIRTSPEDYETALRDWVANGADSPFALSPDEVIERSQPRDADRALGQAHFELAAHLEAAGRHDDAIVHFRRTHQLMPESVSYRRQAWSLEPAGGDLDGPVGRFWQGPVDGAEEDWPYDGDWLTDVRANGAENYYPTWRP